MDDRERTRISAVDRVLRLAERYRVVERDGSSHRYNESRTVNDFILPLLEGLGWDIHNDQAFDEVLPEERSGAGRADWTLSINGIPRLVVEAKALAVELRPEHAKQAIKYAYNRRVTWAVLTNFQEIRLYNAEWALKDPEPTSSLRPGGSSL